MTMLTKDPLGRSRSLWRATLAALTGTIALVGCAGAAEDERDALLQVGTGRGDGAMDAALPDVAADAGAKDAGANDAGAPERLFSDAGADARPPVRFYFDTVWANGTGCPAGTWEAQLSEDGERFVTIFSAFEVEASPARNVELADCQMALRLKSPDGYTFGITDFEAEGYAILAEGQSLWRQTNYYFGGSQLQPRDPMAELNGPYDDTFLMADHVPLTDVVWSPCGLQRPLQVVMRLALDNTVRQDGYARISHVSTIKLAWKKC
jgi:hypothetical protein